MDRAAILTHILRRNALRREAHLPPLDILGEYRRAVAQAYWREVYDEHYATVRADIVRRLRDERGLGWRNSAGARWLVAAMTAKEIGERFGSGCGGPGPRLGYTGLDAGLAEHGGERPH